MVGKNQFGDPWTKEQIIEYVKIYKFRNLLKKHQPSAYAAAYNRGWLDEIFQDCPNQGYVNRTPKWTRELLEKEVALYPTRHKFMKTCSGGYTAARNMGLLDELFKNHHNQGYIINNAWNNKQGNFINCKPGVGCIPASNPVKGIDPEFINYKQNDYRLSDKSPCIDSGINLHEESNYDMDGNTRPLGKGFDMGVYENR